MKTIAPATWICAEREKTDAERGWIDAEKGWIDA
jgi:hypothetical protein